MMFNKLQFEGRVFLAPMAGITDCSFRYICRQYGAAAVISELASSEGVVRESEKTFELLNFTEEERPIGIQLFGANPIVMAEAATIIEQNSPDFIDLNFGCPVKKVVKRGAGAALLKDLSLLEKITLAVVNATSIPITAKIRSGWDNSNINAIEVAKILEGSGVTAITVHPRTQSQYFKHRANWDIIQQVKQVVSIPVIGNGDIGSPTDALNMLTETDCDYIMVGRAALGNPWIFNQINSYLENGSLNSPITIDQIRETCFQHIDLVIKQKGEPCGIKEMRKHLAWYIKGLPFNTSIKTSLFQIHDLKQLIDELERYFLKVKQLKEDSITNDIHISTYN